MQLNAMAVAVCIGVSLSGPVRAAGFQLMEQNASGLGNAYAGSAAVAEDASTVFFNPAGMSRLKGMNVAFSVNAIKPTAKFDDKGSTLPTRITAHGGDGGEAGDLAFVPAGYFTLPLTADLSVGLGLGAPFGLKTEYNRNWVGRFHAVKSEIKTMNINPSLSYKVNDRLALGVGASYQRIEAELTSMFDYSQFLAVSDLEGRVKVEGDDHAWGWNIGALFDLSDTMRLGLSYRSKIDYTLKGKASVVAPTHSNGVVQAGINAVTALANINGRIKADVELPDVATLSVYQRLTDRWEMLGDVSWTGWSTLQELNIVRQSDGTALTSETLKWRDTWRVAFGGSYLYTDTVKLKFGLAWDQSPVRDTSRLPRVPDDDRIWLSLGVQWKPTTGHVLDVGYTHIFVKDPKINNDAGVAAAKGRLVGEYDASVDILGAQYSLSF